jgi:choline dehydrogenase-like flavoprotein
MNSKTGADVVIAGTGMVGCLIAEQMLDAGRSVLMLEAGPDIDRGWIVENYRNMPPSTKFLLPDGPFPPAPKDTGPPLSRCVPNSISCSQFPNHIRERSHRGC